MNLKMTTIMQTKDSFKEVLIADLVGIILDGDERADEAMYYLLRHRLYPPLKRRYEIFQHLLSDDFDDVLDDFFLYLRDGNDQSRGSDQTDGEDPSGGIDLSCGEDLSSEENQSSNDGGTDGNTEQPEPTGGKRVPYPSLRRIRNREAAVLWLLHTFRNYLILRTDREGPLTRSRISADSISVSGSAPSILTDEDKLSFASDLLAYALQKMSPRDGFILLRTLLTMLDKRRSLPNEGMAEALGMTDVSYRVAVHRVRDRLSRYRTRLLQGEPLLLDGPHHRMSQRINEGFLHLYPTLLSFYNQCVGALSPDLADAVSRLRQRHFDSTGNLLHESPAPYGRRYSKAALWNLVERLLIPKQHAL